MQAGLIPVIRYPSCVEASNGNGVQIQALDVEAVVESLRTVAAMPAENLAAMAMKAWHFVRDHHTHERFTEEFRKAVEMALAYHVPAKIIGSRSPDS